MLEARGEARGEVRGEARGEARGVAKAVLKILENRGVPVDERSQDRVVSCTEIEMLNIWLDRSIEVTEIAGLFQD